MKEEHPITLVPVLFKVLEVI